MSGPISTAAKFLIQAGVSGNDLVAALQEIEASTLHTPVVDEAAERRRAKDRERKRAQRLSADIPQNSMESAENTDIPQNSADTIAKEKSPTPPKENNNILTPLSPPLEKSKGRRLPQDWQPDPLTDEWLAKYGVPFEVLETEFDKFRDYWLAIPGSKGRKLDWQGTWRNWLRNGRHPRQGSPPNQTTHRTHMNNLREILADDEHKQRETENHSNPVGLLADSR